MRQGLQIDGAHGIGFGHNNASALLDKARPLAAADAKRKAEIYASAGGARIGRLMVLPEEVGRQMPVAFSRADADRGGRGAGLKFVDVVTATGPGEAAIVQTRDRPIPPRPLVRSPASRRLRGQFL
jgi:Protein of unknown function (DUF541)